jgi:hypothetical protein
MTGVDFREALVNFFTSEIVDKVLCDKTSSKLFVDEAMLSNVNSEFVVNKLNDSGVLSTMRAADDIQPTKE